MKRVVTPTVQQMERSACGAAALSSVLGYHGRFVPLPALRVACGVTRDGCRALDIVRAARRHGLEAHGRRVGCAEAARLPVPFIAHWRAEHFLVVEGFRPGRVFLNDPERGRRHVSPQEFARDFSGVALVFQKGPDFVPAGRPPSLWSGLRRRLRGLAPALGGFALLSLLATLPGLVQPIFGRVLVDEILLAGRSDWLGPLCWGMLATLLVGAALAALQKAALRRLDAGLRARLAASFLGKLLRLPLAFFSSRQPGEIVSRLSLQQKLAGVLSSQLVDATVQVFAALLYLALMLSYDPWLTALSVGCALLSFVGLAVASRTRQDGHRQLLRHRGEAVGISLAALDDPAGLKACALEDEHYRRWAAETAAAHNVSSDWQRDDGLLGVLPELSAGLAAVAILLLGGARVMDGSLSVGMLVAFQGFQLGLQRPLRSALGLVGLSHTLRGDLERLDDVLEAPEVGVDGGSAASANLYATGEPPRPRRAGVNPAPTSGFAPVSVSDGSPAPTSGGAPFSSTHGNPAPASGGAPFSSTHGNPAPASGGIPLPASHGNLAPTSGGARFSSTHGNLTPASVGAPNQGRGGVYPRPSCRVNTPPTLAGDSRTRSATPPTLEVRSLRFGYRPDLPVLQDIEFALAPGRKIAIVGSSGCGKSTLLRLVAGLYAPDAGAVLFDGRPRSAFPKERWSRDVAMVDQDIRLFPGSFLENLTLWDPSVPFAKVREACRDALIEELILRRPGGYAAPVAEGGKNLSGGQRQRLELARALVHEPKLLLLDEASSALDPACERRLERNLKRRGCARLVIAHRLSTVKDADEILVLAAGRIAQRGTHTELLAVPGLYRALLAAEGACR